MRVHRWLWVLSAFLAVSALAQEGQWVHPDYNFSSYDILIRRELLRTGATLIFYDQDGSGLNGFYAPSCTVTLAGRQRKLSDAIAINVDVVLRQGLTVSQVVAHELTHYRQRLRSGSLAAYLREWRRQQELPYDLRPWELEAHEAERHAPELVRIAGRRALPPVSVVFEKSSAGVAAADRR